MKRLSFLLCLLALVVVVSGCCLDEQVKTKTHENRVAMEAFIKFIDEGKTTREMEQKMLRTNLKNWLALDYYINEDEEAKKKLDELEKKPDDQ